MQLVLQIITIILITALYGIIAFDATGTAIRRYRKSKRIDPIFIAFIVLYTIMYIRAIIHLL